MYLLGYLSQWPRVGVYPDVELHRVLSRAPIYEATVSGANIDDDPLTRGDLLPVAISLPVGSDEFPECALVELSDGMPTNSLNHDPLLSFSHYTATGPQNGVVATDRVGLGALQKQGCSDVLDLFPFRV
jgi:hypothetical protein